MLGDMHFPFLRGTALPECSELPQPAAAAAAAGLGPGHRVLPPPSAGPSYPEPPGLPTNKSIWHGSICQIVNLTGVSDV